MSRRGRSSPPRVRSRRTRYECASADRDAHGEDVGTCAKHAAQKNWRWARQQPLRHPLTCGCQECMNAITLPCQTAMRSAPGCTRSRRMATGSKPGSLRAEHGCPGAHKKATASAAAAGLDATRSTASGCERLAALSRTADAPGFRKASLPRRWGHGREGCQEERTWQGGLPLSAPAAQPSQALFRTPATNGALAGSSAGSPWVAGGVLGGSRCDGLAGRPPLRRAPQRLQLLPHAAGGEGLASAERTAHGYLAGHPQAAQRDVQRLQLRRAGSQQLSHATPAARPNRRAALSRACRQSARPGVPSSGSSPRWRGEAGGGAELTQCNG